MESRPPKRIRKLVDRYLNPMKSWDQGLDHEMRALLRDSEAGRDYYNQSIVTHRLLVSGDAEEATGFERERLFMAISGVELPERAPDGAFWARFAGILGAAAAVLIFALQPVDRLSLRSGPGTSDYIGSRGHQQNTTLVGLDIAGVDRSGRAYEIDTATVASAGVKVADGIRLSYTNEAKGLGYLFVFGVQRGNDFVWYAPDPKEGTSVQIKRGKTQALFEVDAAAPHRPGALRIIALFTTRPVALKRVKALGADFFLKSVRRGLHTRIYKALGLDRRRDVVSVRETVIQPPTKPKPKTPDGR